MPSAVTVSIVGRNYEIACDEGQEDYLRNLAADLDRRASDLLRSVGAVGEARLLVMLALLLADELSEHRSALERLQKAGDPADAALAGGIQALARRLDAIAERLENA